MSVVNLFSASCLPRAAGAIAPEVSPGAAASPYVWPTVPEVSSGLPAMIEASFVCRSSGSMRTNWLESSSVGPRSPLSVSSVYSRCPLRTAVAPKSIEAVTHERSTALSTSSEMSLMASAPVGKRSSAVSRLADSLPPSIS